MATEDPLLPRKQGELDEKLAEARQNLAGIKRRRLLLLLAYYAAIAVEGGLIAVTVITKDEGWISLAGPGGLGVLFATGYTAEYLVDEHDPDFSRTGLIRARTTVDQLLIAKRELAVGRARGKLAVYSRYRETMPDLVIRYRGQANQYKRVNDFLQSFIIVASLLTSAVTGIFGASKNIRLAVVGVTLSVAIASSMASYFKLRERSAQLHKTADMIESEFRAVELGIGHYSDKSEADALRLFVERVEEVRGEHMTRQRQLDQPADLRHIDQSSINVERTV